VKSKHFFALPTTFNNIQDLERAKTHISHRKAQGVQRKKNDYPTGALSTCAATTGQSKLFQESKSPRVIPNNTNVFRSTSQNPNAKKSHF